MIKFRLHSSRFYDSQNHDNWLDFSRSVIGSIARRVSVCRLCGSRSGQQELCAACKNDLPWRITPWQQHLPHIDGVWAAFDFAYPIRQLIHRVKYGRDIACARLLGELLAERLALAVDIPRTGTLFPVPLARGRMWARGFNQAMELCLPITHQHKLLIDEVSVYKPLARKTQSRLNAANRRANIRGAFQRKGLIRCETAIIVDDVLTTGATVSAVARVLKQAGAKSVFAWVVAAA